MKEIILLILVTSLFGLFGFFAQAENKKGSVLEVKPHEKSFSEVTITPFCKFGLEFLVAQSDAHGNPSVVQVSGADGKPLHCTEEKKTAE